MRDYDSGHIPGAVFWNALTTFVLPDFRTNLDTAAVEQVAVWFQDRDKLGLIRHWPSGGVYMVFTQLPLLPQVSAMLRPYRRWAV